MKQFNGKPSEIQKRINEFYAQYAPKQIGSYTENGMLIKVYEAGFAINYQGRATISRNEKSNAIGNRESV